MNMTELENKYGSFTATIAALKAGDADALIGTIGTNPYLLTVDSMEGTWGAKLIMKRLCLLESTGVARVSRRGNRIVDHPYLGQLMWKTRDIESGTQMILSVKGTPILDLILRFDGSFEKLQWLTGAGDKKGFVEQFLG